MNGTGQRRALTKRAQPGDEDHRSCREGATVGSTPVESARRVPQGTARRRMRNPAPARSTPQTRIAAPDGSTPARCALRLHRRVGWPTPDRGPACHTVLLPIPGSPHTASNRPTGPGAKNRSTAPQLRRAARQHRRIRRPRTLLHNPFSSRRLAQASSAAGTPGRRANPAAPSRPCDAAAGPTP